MSWADTGSQDAVSEEQEYVSMLYDRLDAARAAAERRAGETYRAQTAGTDAAMSERDSFAARYERRSAQLAAVDRGLCFGRLGTSGGGDLHIGRVGLLDDDYEPLLVDWRAPAARPFYRATPAAPLGVVRRRHIRSRGRTVVGVDDDILDLETLRAAARAGGSGSGAGGDAGAPLTGEAALMASLLAARTGRMGDIVATIQAEQDRVIRSDPGGILVVDGGPGTGKTVVALHRAAYLLYTYREQLASSGVLVVGPTATFLRYIDRVLPSLGETDVVAATLPELYPGVRVSGWDRPETAAVKGDPRMVDVLAAAVRDRQEVPDRPVPVLVEDDELTLRPEACERARERARDLAAESGEPHNRARRYFVAAVVGELTEQLLDRLRDSLAGSGDLTFEEPPLVEGEEPGGDIADMVDPTGLRSTVARAPAVHEVLDRLWPELTPQRLLSELYAGPERLRSAAPQLSEAERGELARPVDSPWTAADVPLLDEAAGLLGPTDAQVAGRAEGAAAAAAEEAERYAVARDVMASAVFPELVPRLSEIAEHYREEEVRGPLAEQALADREWAYGHVIVDEAQELSAMAWRMVARRCPRRSMTVVGDLAQRAAGAGAASWAKLLDPATGGRWRRDTLTVNYRTPAEIMAVAADVLAAIDPGLEPPTSVRRTGTRPWAERVDDLLRGLAGVVRRERAALGDGKLAVIVPDERVAEVGRHLAGPDVAVAGAPDALEADTLVCGAGQAKGLEFDAVVVADPQAMVAASERGLSDLYVAVTRATRRLGVVHTGELPAVLSRLRPRRGRGRAAGARA